VGSQQLELVGTQQRLVGREDDAVAHAELAVGIRRVRFGGAETDQAGAATEVASAQLRGLAVVDGEVVVPLVGEDPELGRQVVLEGPVTVQVVRRQVDEDAALRPEVRGVLELEARRLADDRGVRVDRTGQGRERRTDVAGDGDRETGGPVQVPDQLGRRGLAVRAGDRAEGVRDQSPCELELAGDLEAALAGGANDGSVLGHAGALDQRSSTIE
jgi:hypothetical protein